MSNVPPGSAQGSGVENVIYEDDFYEYEAEPTTTLAINTGAIDPVEPPASETGETTAMGNVSFLRLVLQEVIPSGGDDSDTIFLDQHLVEMLNRGFNIISVAAAMGWAIKAGYLATMTDRNDGLSEKKLSQASVAAQSIARMWQTRADLDLVTISRSVRPQAIAFTPYRTTFDDLWQSVYDASHPDRFYLPYFVIDGG